MQYAFIRYFSNPKGNRIVDVRPFQYLNGRPIPAFPVHP
jgi:hypothetical protein